MDAARWELRKALYEVKATCRRGLPLGYAMLERITKNLSPRELRQFIEYTIRQYDCIRYDDVIRYYGSYDKMVTAINSNTGSEYDLKEDTYAKDHRIYRTMINHLIKTEGWTSMKEVLSLPETQRRKIASKLMLKLNASEKEVTKLLRL